MVGRNAFVAGLIGGLGGYAIWILLALLTTSVFAEEPSKSVPDSALRASIISTLASQLANAEITISDLKGQVEALKQQLALPPDKRQ